MVWGTGSKAVFYGWASLTTCWCQQLEPSVLLLDLALPLALVGSCTELTQLVNTAELSSSKNKNRSSIFLLISKFIQSSAEPKKCPDQFKQVESCCKARTGRRWTCLFQHLGCVGVMYSFTPTVLVSGWNLLRYCLHSWGHYELSHSISLRAKPAL